MNDYLQISFLKKHIVCEFGKLAEVLLQELNIKWYKNVSVLFIVIH